MYLCSSKQAIAGIVFALSALPSVGFAQSNSAFHYEIPGAAEILRDDDGVNTTTLPLSPGKSGVQRPARKHRQAQTAPSAPPPVRKPEYTLNNTGKGYGTFGGDQSGHVDGDVIINVIDPESHDSATLYADTADYDGKTGMVTASGTAAHPVRLVTADGTLSGDHVSYNFAGKTGIITQASLVSDTFKVRGESIEARADGSYIAYNAMFTGCDHGTLDERGGVPDYRISAHKITIVPGEYITATRVTFYLGRQRTIPLPSFRRNLEEPSTVNSLPFPSYSKTNGLTLHVVGQPLIEQHTTFDYDTYAGLTHLPIGYFLYQNDITRNTPLALPPRGTLPSLGDPLNSLLQQFNPPNYTAYTAGRPYEVYPDRVTFYGVLGNAQNIFNRQVTGLTLSRLPEVGVHFGNILGKLPQDSTTGQSLRIDQIPYAPALLEAYTSLGVLHESPSGVTSARLYTRLNFASQPMVIGKRISWRYGASNWLNGYSRGSVYELFAPEAEVDYVPTKTSQVNVGYRYLTDAGKTPFVFDRRDIRHELRMQYQVGGPYLFSILSRYDMEKLRAYDEEIAVVRRLDCLQYGISYSVRMQSFIVIFNLLPGRKPASAASARP